MVKLAKIDVIINAKLNFAVYLKNIQMTLLKLNQESLQTINIQKLISMEQKEKL